MPAAAKTKKGARQKRKSEGMPAETTSRHTKKGSSKCLKKGKRVWITHEVIMQVTKGESLVRQHVINYYASEPNNFWFVGTIVDGNAAAGWWINLDRMPEQAGNIKVGTMSDNPYMSCSGKIGQGPKKFPKNMFDSNGRYLG